MIELGLHTDNWRPLSMGHDAAIARRATVIGGNTNPRFGGAGVANDAAARGSGANVGCGGARRTLIHSDPIDASVDAPGGNHG